MIALWRKKILFSTGKLTLFFLFCFYFLFFSVDYALHISALHLFRVPFSQLSLYYGVQFFKRLEITLSFALLLATLYQVIRSIRDRELVPLFVGGVSLKSYLATFWSLSLFSIVILYGNEECFLPRVLPFITRFEAKYLGKRGKNSSLKRVLYLSEEEQIFYQTYSVDRREWRDLYWITSPHSLLHAHTLTSLPPDFQARFVDFFSLSSSGHFSLQNRQLLCNFSLPLRIGFETLSEREKPPLHMAFSQVYRAGHLALQRGDKNRARELFAHVHEKLSLFILSLLTPPLAAYSSLSWSRSPFFFLTLLCNLLFFLSSHFFRQSAAFLLQREVVSPLFFWVTLFTAVVFYVGCIAIKEMKN